MFYILTFQYYSCKHILAKWSIILQFRDIMMMPWQGNMFKQNWSILGKTQVDSNHKISVIRNLYIVYDFTLKYLKQTAQLPAMWDTMTLIWRLYYLSAISRWPKPIHWHEL